VLDAENADTALVDQVAQQRAEPLGLLLVQPTARFVEQQDPEIARDDASEFDQAPLAGREVRRTLVAQVGDTHELERLLDA
jgi:hypothetical protein